MTHVDFGLVTANVKNCLHVKQHHFFEPILCKKRLAAIEIDKNPELENKEALLMLLGSVRLNSYDLKTDRRNGYTLTWKPVLLKRNESYIQYAYAHPPIS